MAKDKESVKTEAPDKPEAEKPAEAVPKAEAAAPGGADPAAAPGADPAAVGKERKARGRASRTVSTGIAHVRSTFNNTVVTITDMKGAVLGWSSSGRMGFKGARKSTAYAATVVAQDVARQAQAYRMQEVEVRVQGPGAGRESAIRALQASGLSISLIRDITPVPHNGCRPRKRRRV
jgi:small subunit ribosomal protein S11